MLCFIPEVLMFLLTTVLKYKSVDLNYMIPMSNPALGQFSVWNFLVVQTIQLLCDIETKKQFSPASF